MSINDQPNEHDKNIAHKQPRNFYKGIRNDPKKNKSIQN